MSNREIAQELRALAEEIESNIDWSDGRSGYADNLGYEHSARILRARADELMEEA